MSARNTSNTNKFDPIKTITQNTSINHEQLSELLHKSRQTITNYNHNQTSIPANIMKSLKHFSGLSYKLLFNDHSENITFFPDYKAGAYALIKQKADSIETILDNERTSNISLGIEKYKTLYKFIENSLDSHKSIIHNAKKKITIAVLGLSGVGKTDLVYDLIGKHNFSPDSIRHTEYPVFFHHTDDLPQNLFPAGLNVSVNAVITFNDTNNTKIWGDYENLTKKYQNSKPDNNETNTYTNDYTEIKEIDVYIDSEILKDIILVDTPSMNVILEREGRLPDYLSDNDILIYVTTFHTIASDTEEYLFSSLLKNGITLNNMLFVISKTDLFIKDKRNVVDQMIDKFQQKLTALYYTSSSLSEKESYNTSENVNILSRSYKLYISGEPDESSTMPDVFVAKENAKLFLNALSQNISRLYTEKLKQFYNAEVKLCADQKELFSKINETNESILSQGQLTTKDYYSKAYHKIEEIKDSIEKYIDSLMNQATKHLDADYKKICTEKTLMQILPEKKIEPKDIQKALSVITNTLSDSVESTLAESNTFIYKKYGNDVLSNIKSNLSTIEDSTEFKYLCEKYLIELEALKTQNASKRHEVIDYYIKQEGRKRKKDLVGRITDKYNSHEKTLPDVLEISGNLSSTLLTGGLLANSPIGWLAAGLTTATILGTRTLYKYRNQNKKAAQTIIENLNKSHYLQSITDVIKKYYQSWLNFTQYIDNFKNICERIISIEKPSQTDNDSSPEMNKMIYFGMKKMNLLIEQICKSENEHLKKI